MFGTDAEAQKSLSFRFLVAAKQFKHHSMLDYEIIAECAFPHVTPLRSSKRDSVLRCADACIPDKTFVIHMLCMTFRLWVGLTHFAVQCQRMTFSRFHFIQSKFNWYNFWLTHKLCRAKMDINQLNIETAIFLRRLRMFSEQKDQQLNGKTTELFVDIIRSVDKLMAAGDMAHTERNDNLDFLFNLDGKQFDVRQHVMCRLCIVSWLFFFFFALLCNSSARLCKC